MSTSNLTIGEILARTAPFLSEKGIPNARLEADLMLAFILDLPRVKLYSQWDRPLMPTEIQRYRELIVKRVKGWPMAYLIGKKSFLSWDFIVNPAVLIPRPETELLVEAVYDRVKSRPGLEGIDVGTGSGAIAISLAKLLPDSHWQGVDISGDALKVAAQNAAQLGVTAQVAFFEGDLLEAYLNRNQKFDVIVSNPPYIPAAEIASLQAEVKKEPVLALDGGEDGLKIYRRLLPQAVACLKPDGFIAVEHGFDQKKALTQLFETHGFTWEAITDLAGMDRIIICRPALRSGF